MRRSVQLQQPTREAQRTAENVSQVQRGARADRKADKKRQFLTFLRPADLTAKDANGYPWVSLPRPIRVVGIEAVALAAIPESGAYATIAVTVGNGTGQTFDDIAKVKTSPKSSGGTGTWAGGRSVDFGKVDRVLPAGSVLVVEKSGGTKLPVIALTLEYEELD